MNERVTAAAVARFLDGESSPEECRRVLEAIETDPEIAALAELLAPVDEDDDLEPDPEVKNLIREQTNRLQHSRLWAIEPIDPERPLSRLANGEAVDAKIVCDADERGGWLPLRIRKSEAADRFVLECEWPNGVDPIGLVVGPFDFQSRRIEYRQGDFKIPDAVRRQTDSMTAADSSAAYVMSAATGKERQQSGEESSFSVEVGSTLTVKGRMPRSFSEEIVLMELSYDGSKSGHPIQHPVRLEATEEGSGLGVAEVDDFPWPTDAASSKGELVVRPLESKDMSIFSPDEVSVVLSQHTFEPFPLWPKAGAFDFGVRFDDQRAAIAAPNNSWFVRVVVAGKEVG